MCRLVAHTSTYELRGSYCCPHKKKSASTHSCLPASQIKGTYLPITVPLQPTYTPNKRQTPVRHDRRHAPPSCRRGLAGIPARPAAPTRRSRCHQGPSPSEGTGGGPQPGLEHKALPPSSVPSVRRPPPQRVDIFHRFVIPYLHLPSRLLQGCYREKHNPAKQMHAATATKRTHTDHRDYEPTLNAGRDMNPRTTRRVTLRRITRRLSTRKGG